MKLHTFKDRASIYHKVYVYEVRRDTLWDRHGRTSSEYKERVKGINRGLKRYRKVIREIDRRSEEVINLAKKVQEFTGINVKDSHNRISDNYLKAKGLFCKYGIENGIRGILLSEYLGAHKYAGAIQMRRRFTRSFQKDVSNKDIWESFKIYLEELEDTGVLKAA